VLREHVTNGVLAASFSTFAGQSLTLPKKFAAGCGEFVSNTRAEHHPRA
jgi:hypothetical protein